VFVPSVRVLNVIGAGSARRELRSQAFFYFILFLGVFVPGISRPPRGQILPVLGMGCEQGVLKCFGKRVYAAVLRI
jgi:hypothetical protein